MLKDLINFTSNLNFKSVRKISHFNFYKTEYTLINANNILVYNIGIPLLMVLLKKRIYSFCEIVYTQYQYLI